MYIISIFNVTLFYRWENKLKKIKFLVQSPVDYVLETGSESTSI